jgi:hypothetical protein
MDDFANWLEHQLVDAGRRRQRRRRRRLPTAGVTRLAGNVVVPVAGIVVAALVAAIAIALLHHRAGMGVPGPPTPPPTTPAALLPANPTHTQRQEENYLYNAWEVVLRKDRGCSRARSSNAKPTFSQGSPSPQLLSLLSVLRRPATSADKLPARITYNPYRRDPTGTLPPVQGIYVRYIRYARHRDGANYYLVPAENVNWMEPVPARCYTEQRAALRQELPGVPAQLRAGVLALEPRFAAQLHYDTSPHPGVCLLGLNDTGNGDGGCGGAATVSSLEQGHPLESGAPGGVPVVDGLAPDGVRSIAFYYRGRYPGHPLTALVINNVFVLHNPRDRLPNEGFPTKVVWRAADGHVIKTFNRGPSG